MTKYLLGALAALSFAAFAQGPGPGGPGPGPGYGGPGYGGPGPGRGPRMGAGITPGWALMTPEERRAHQEKMRSLKDPAECEAYMTGHHDLMAARAKERNQALPWNGPRPFCDYLKRKPA
jgi:hypothetical protein